VKRDSGEPELTRQFNMRVTEDMFAKMQQLAVDLSVENKRVTHASEVVRCLIEEAWKRRGRKRG
jgi:hypothetical protein